jgi:hypothetical protein
MLSIYETYDFQRDSNGKTVSLSITVGIYRGELPTKKVLARTTPDQDVDFTEFTRVDLDSATPLETITIPWNIPSDLQTTALPADRSGSTPERYTEFDENLMKLKMEFQEDGDYENAIETLMSKYR